MARKTTDEVRVQVDANGAEWFSVKDACDAIGLASRAREVVSSLDDDKKWDFIQNTPGGPRKMSAVSEPGLYALIIRSNKPKAEAFKRWVTHDVLPQIRRAGQPCGFEHDSVRIDDLMRDISSNLAALTASEEAPASFDDTRKLLAMADESGCNPLDIALALAMKTAAECGQWEIVKLLTESIRDTRVEF